MNAMTGGELRIFWIQRMDGSLQMVWGAEVILTRRNDLNEGRHGG